MQCMRKWMLAATTATTSSSQYAVASLPHTARKNVR